ncbi:hypothetical protein GCM10007147_11230 [Nocardiopsis kunsanensis]|uniref:Uncharacterized protein n=1 Tax=Nocardiopsis kunsanensis TaxID=141693 RepID=A0A918X9N8_9ACTN|nr:hypothetical protein GCM10007147_11230 [Nocardiopsis kunsanensis]
MLRIVYIEPVTVREGSACPDETSRGLVRAGARTFSVLFVHSLLHEQEGLSADMDNSPFHGVRAKGR